MNAPFTYASPTLSVEALKHSIAYKLMFTIGKDPVIANKHEWLNATLFAVRDRLVERWLRSNRAQLSQETRQVYYLSMEFLIGRTLSNALLSLGIYDDVKGALEAMGLDLEELIDEENDPGLGNGGLGRLAACFLDSLATLGLPGRGYGIRYDYGMFKQNIVDGRQKESPDYWLEYGNPWEFKRHNTRYKVLFGGRIQQEGKKARWIETEEILAVAYDQIIPGYDTDATNTLRLWNAQASSEINLGKFNQATTLRRWKIKTTLRTFHGCSTRTIPPIPDESYACARSIFWSRRRCRISCTVIINCIKPMRIWRIKSPFTSMIRIRCCQFLS